MNSENTHEQFDLIIIGGGLVGASLACALGSTGLRVAVIETTPFSSEQQPSFDARTVALAYVSRQIFSAMGVWSRIEELGVAAIRHIHVSDRGHAGVTRMHNDEVGRDALGYVVETRVLGQALMEKLHSLPAVTLFCPAALQAFNVEQEAAHVSFDYQGETHRITAPLLVAADGGDSMVRRLSGMGIYKFSYAQTAVIANVDTDTPHAERAFERFTDTGPMALLPMTDGTEHSCRYALVWTVRDGEKQPLLSLADVSFLEKLQQRFGERAGRFLRVSPRVAYPLSLMQAREHVRERIAIIGNAAHTVHPVSGQGLNLGLRDVAALSQVIVDAQRAGRDTGELSVLQDYAQWRRRDHLQTAAATDSLVRVFSTDWLPVAAVRNAGLLVMDLFPPLKKRLMRHAMGYVGKLPRLARGLPL